MPCSCGNATRDIRDDTINTFRLTIGLRVIHCKHVQTGAQHLEVGLPKPPREAVVTIRYNSRRQDVLTEDSVKDRQAVQLHVLSV